MTLHSALSQALLGAEGAVMNKMDLVWLSCDLHSRGGCALVNKMDVILRLGLGGSGRASQRG